MTTGASAHFISANARKIEDFNSDTGACKSE